MGEMFSDAAAPVAARVLAQKFGTPIVLVIAIYTTVSGKTAVVIAVREPKKIVIFNPT